MRRTVLISASVFALCAALLSATPVQGQTSPPTTESRDQMVTRLRDERRGLVYDGLRYRPGGPCGEGFEIVAAMTNGSFRCTHGPDPAPDGVDVRFPQAIAPPSVPALAAAEAGIPCYGTGSDGFRVQLLYVRQTGSVDKSASLFPNFVTYAANATAIFNDSAAKTGGTRNVRFVTDASCNLVIAKVEVSAASISNFSTFISELAGKGYNRTDRKYLSWVDATRYCGIAEIYKDSIPFTTPGLSTSNSNNGSSIKAGMNARVDTSCWGKSQAVEAHELTHVLGGVQPGAPHATLGFHCKDESDRLCYDDGSAGASQQVQVCAPTDERLLDCKNDDYYNTNPTSGYLTNHWNVANSAFLSGTSSNPPPTTTTLPPPPPPTTTTTVPATTTTAPPPTTTTTAPPPPPPTTTTTAPPPPPPPTTTTVPPPPPTTLPPAPTTTVAPVGPAPSAPRNLFATRPASGPGVRLLWSPPVTGPVTGYNVYRKTGTGAYVKIADVGVSSGFTDTTTVSGVSYTYTLSAENGANEGPRSTTATFTAV